MLFLSRYSINSELSFVVSGTAGVSVSWSKLISENVGILSSVSSNGGISISKSGGNGNALDVISDKSNVSVVVSFCGALNADV